MIKYEWNYFGSFEAYFYLDFDSSHIDDYLYIGVNDCECFIAPYCTAIELIDGSYHLLDLFCFFLYLFGLYFRFKSFDFPHLNFEYFRNIFDYFSCCSSMFMAIN